MIYLVPAWHELLNDWSFSTPRIEFDDAISHLRTIQKGGQEAGLIITDYQPHILTKLGQLAISPDDFLSAFDYLQGINGLEGHVIDYRDLPWPEGAYFNFTNFRICVMDGSDMYAKIILDVQGKILWIEYYQGDQAGNKLLFDSRGFVSRLEQGDVFTYFDPAGKWRFKHNQKTDEVEINSAFDDLCRQKHYQHMSDLVTEIVNDQLLPKLGEKDRALVTVDDGSLVPIDSYDNCHPIYSASRWHPYEKTLPQIKQGPVAVDTDKRAEAVGDVIPEECPVTVLPLFQSQFKLGHSQRLSQQRIAVFVEYMSPDELMELMELIYPRLLKNPKDEGLFLFSYSPEKAGMAHQVFEEFRKRHDGEFILSLDEFEPGENQLTEELMPPLLTIKEQRFTSGMDALTALDKIRLMILWNQPDQFMTMAAVSVGIPLLQNFTSEEVNEKQNGLIYKEIADLKEGIEYYLDSLKHWNNSLVYNVQMLNRYSEDNLLKIWNQILESED